MKAYSADSDNVFEYGLTNYHPRGAGMIKGAAQYFRFASNMGLVRYKTIIKRNDLIE